MRVLLVADTGDVADALALRDGRMTLDLPVSAFARLALAPDALVLDLPEDPVTMQGDALSLAEAGKNLGVNAARHGRTR